MKTNPKRSSPAPSRRLADSMGFRHHKRVPVDITTFPSSEWTWHTWQRGLSEKRRSIGSDGDGEQTRESCKTSNHRRLRQDMDPLLDEDLGEYEDSRNFRRSVHGKHPRTSRPAHRFDVGRSVPTQYTRSPQHRGMHRPRSILLLFGCRENAER